MRSSILVFFFLKLLAEALNLAPGNDDIRNAFPISTVKGYCSAEGAFTTTDATSSGYQKGALWPTEGKDVWFKFTATNSDLSVTVTGKTISSGSNTLLNPLIAFYTFDGLVLTEMIGSMSTSNHVTTAYKGGLSAGQEYYIRISADQNQTGTFKICINNYRPTVKAGQDCSTAAFLCNKETFSELSLSGAGDKNTESAGTCIGTESNSAWYKWIAADDGTLTFAITPSSNTDDIDWVLYDLGENGECISVNAANAIRCAVGNGINCSPSYFITGLNLTSTDLSEQKNCPPGQDGWLKYVDMIQGHTYALLIDNFSSGNNGFTLSFGGSGTFSGPAILVKSNANNPCTASQTFTLSAEATNYDSFMWSFGDGASLATAGTLGPHELTYSSPGIKNISLEAKNASGCKVTTYYSLLVSEKPIPPVISASGTNLCIGEVLQLTTPGIPTGTYLWTGPNNFTSMEQNPQVSISGPENAGYYKLVVKSGACESEPSILQVASVAKKPIPAFYTIPGLNAKYTLPLTVSLINQSANSDTFLWDFGDGSTSRETSPQHIYTSAGTYKITLTASTANFCSSAVSKGSLVLLDNAKIFIPSVFSPNGDGINDEFRINMTNLNAYHIIVVNRWGITVFESTSILRNWDGKFNNKELPVGVYYYRIRAEVIEGKPLNQSGSVVLMR